MILRKRWFQLVVAVCIIVGILAALIFIGPGIPGVVRTFYAQRMPFQNLSVFLGGSLNGHVTVHSAFYVPGASTLLLELSSDLSGTVITYLKITRESSSTILTNCPGGSSRGGGGLPAGCYPKNVVLGTTKVWLITPLNPCGDFVENWTIQFGMSQLANSTMYTLQNDPTSKVSAVQVQCVFPHATEVLTLVIPFTELQFGSLPGYELLTSGGPVFNSSTNATLFIQNNGTLPVTITRYSVSSAAFNGQYNSTALNGPTIAIGNAGTLSILTDSAHSFRVGYCYGVVVSSLGHSQFVFISCH
jgi:hypothetical protein